MQLVKTVSWNRLFDQEKDTKIMTALRTYLDKVSRGDKKADLVKDLHKLVGNYES